MLELEFFAGFTIASIVIDQVVSSRLFSKILNILLILFGVIYAEIHIFNLIPLAVGALVYVKSSKITAQSLKLITFILILFSYSDDIFWKLLLTLFLYLYPLRFNTFQSNKVSLVTVSTIYSICIFLLGAWLLYLNGESGAGIYRNYQLPIALAFLVISIVRCFNILDSVKVMRVIDQFYTPGERITLLLINKFYIPLFILEILKTYITAADDQVAHNLSAFVSAVIMISSFKHFYEIKYVGRSVSNITLVFNYFAAVFFASTIFLNQEYNAQVIGGITYLIVIYSSLIFLEGSPYESKIKPILILIFLPTPLSLNFYQSIKVYHLLTLANFPLMASTFILIIVFSFLLKIDLFGKYNCEYDEIPYKA